MPLSHLPKKVSVLTPPKNDLPNLRISSNPRRMTADLVLLPYLREEIEVNVMRAIYQTA